MDEEKLKDLKDEYIDHMMNPRNYGTIKNPDGFGIGKNPFNNELVNMHIKVKDGSLEDVKFECIGCMSTVVTGSIFTDMIIGESLEEGEDVALEFIKNLENAPIDQRACGEMVAKAYLAAVQNYKNRQAGSKEESYTMQISNDCYGDEETNEEEK